MSNQKRASLHANSTRLLTVAGICVIVLATFAAYFPSLQGGFIMDDDLYLTQSSLIRMPGGLAKLWFSSEPNDYYPVSNTSLWIEWRLWEMNPTGYHLTNLILHFTAALLIWRILQTLSIPGSFFAALLFAIHPLNVESVAWISQRKGLLAMLFFLLSIWCYLKPSRVSIKSSWYWFSLLAFLIAMLSKGSVAVLPVMLLLIVWWQRRKITMADLFQVAPFFALAIFLTCVNIWFLNHGADDQVRHAGLIQRLLGAGETVWFYLAKSFAPLNLLFIYPYWKIETNQLLWWLPVTAAVFVTAYLIPGQFRSQTALHSRAILFAWLFFCVALIPVLGFTDVGFMRYSLVADHYQHLALIALAALVAAAFAFWHRRSAGAFRNAITVAAAALACTLAVLTWQQNRLYANPVALYQATLDQNPDCWVAHNNMAAALIDANRPAEAVAHCREALRLKPDYPDAYSNLGSALLNVGQIPAAIESLQHAIQMNPLAAAAHFNLAKALIENGQPEEAQQQISAAIQLRPFKAATIESDLADSLSKSNHPQAAIDFYMQALQKNPADAETHYNLGNALAKANRTAEAIQHYQQAIQLKPDYADPHNNLGFLFASADRTDDAIAQYHQALQIDPQFALAHDNLGTTLLNIGQPDKAVLEFQKSVRLQPHDADAYINLGVALARIGRSAEAVAALEQAVRLKADSPRAHSNLGLAFSQLRRYSEAMEQFQTAIKLQPDFCRAYASMADTYAQLQQRPQAIAAAEKAIQLAREQNQTALAQQVELWLSKYQSAQPTEHSQTDSPSTPSAPVAH